MGYIIGVNKSGFNIVRSSQEEMEELNEALSFKQYYKNGKNGTLATFYTPHDNCAYSQYKTEHSLIGKYEVRIIVLGSELKFKVNLGNEDSIINKKVRLEYYNAGKASKKTKEIVEKYYK